jgi:hypothetical protein
MEPCDLIVKEMCTKPSQKKIVFPNQFLPLQLSLRLHEHPLLKRSQTCDIQYFINNFCTLQQCKYVPLLLLNNYSDI